MKVKTTYICDACNREYQKETYAEECENTHFIPQSIKSYEFSRTDNKKEFPESITVEIQNCHGSKRIIQFKRKV